MAIHVNCINPILDLTLENFSFSVRVINIWNALPYSVLQRHLDLYFKNKGISISFDKACSSLHLLS